MHRKVLHEGFEWPLITNPNPTVPAGTQMLNPIIVKTPDAVARQFTRGFDISQVTSSAIMSRNITAALSTTAHDQTAVGLPVKIRLVHGYSKMPVAGDLHSVTSTGGAFDGVVITFDPLIKYEEAAFDTFRDSIGNTNGVPDPKGNIQRETISVVSDRDLNMTAETALGGTIYFKPEQSNYTWKGGRQVRQRNF